MNPYIIAAAVAAVLAVLAGAYNTGVNAERKRGEAASLRAQIKIKDADIDAARKSEADARASESALAQAATSDRIKLNEIEKAIATRPLADRCALSRDDVNRLLSIR